MHPLFGKGGCGARYKLKSSVLAVRWVGGSTDRIEVFSMRIGRVGISGATVAVVVGLSLGLSSCGGTSPNTHTASAKPKVSATSTTTVVNRRESAVLTAYRAGWTAYDQALA